MANFWDEQNDVFRDGMPEDENAEPMDYSQMARPAPRQVAPPQPKPAPKRVVEPEPEVVQEQAEDDEDYTDVLSDARLRLEQGRLYELLMNHNLFDGVEADPRAIKNVQREIRQYAKERMEIMLGMRQPKADPQVAGGFNDVEMTVLKLLAKTASKGKTETPAPPVRTGLAPMQASAPAPQQAIRPMVAKTVQATPTPKPKAAPPKPAPKPVQKPAPKPIERVKNDVVDRILREEGISRDVLEEDYRPLSKDPSQMTEEERIERNKQTSRRLQKQVAPSNPMPMPTYEQQAMRYAAEASEIVSSGPMSMLIAAVSKRK